jgi:hypothetical protein
MKVEGSHRVLVRNHSTGGAIEAAGTIEQLAMAHPLSYWCLALTLAAAAFATRWMTNAAAKQNGPEIQFEEYASDELIGLGLNG